MELAAKNTVKGDLGVSFMVSAVLFGLIYFFLGETRNYYETVGVFLFLFTFTLFVRRTKNFFPLKELLAFVAILQWLVGPIVMYRLDNPHPIYKMYVEESVYMDFALPGTILFLIGLLMPLGQKMISEVNHGLRMEMLSGNLNESVAKKLIGLGFLASFISAPGGFGFIAFLFSQTLYIGALILYTNSGFKNKLWLGVVALGMFNSILASASFHTPVIWLTMFFIFRTWKEQWSYSKIYFLFFLGGIVVFFIQFVKTDFRSELDSRAQNRDELIWNKTLDNLEDTDAIFSEAGMLKQLPRMNQGGVVSRVMAHTPVAEPFANGETIVDTFIAVFLPRFLAPNKKKAGGRENYQRFTGFEIRPGTSINISPLGEMWANFGSNGIWGMLFFGLAVNLIWFFYYKFARDACFLLLWLPLFFLQTVKAETDILTPLNHMFKSAIIIYIFFKWVFPNFKYKIKPVLG